MSATLELALPLSVVQSCAHLRDGELFEMSGCHGGTAHGDRYDLKLQGTATADKLKLIFQDDGSNSLEEFLKQTWKCEVVSSSLVTMETCSIETQTDGTDKAITTLTRASRRKSERLQKSTEPVNVPDVVEPDREEELVMKRKRGRPPKKVKLIKHVKVKIEPEETAPLTRESSPVLASDADIHGDINNSSMEPLSDNLSDDDNVDDLVDDDLSFGNSESVSADCDMKNVTSPQMTSNTKTIENMTEIISSSTHCRICDSDFVDVESVKSHVISVHSVTWNEYRDVVCVIEIHYRKIFKRNTRKRHIDSLDCEGEDDENTTRRSQLPHGKKEALRILRQWRKKHSKVGRPKKTISGDQGEETEDIKPIVVSDRVLQQCAECGLLFQRKTNLRNHMRLAHCQQDIDAIKHRRDVVKDEGSASKYSSILSKNTELCKALGILEADVDESQVMACIMCEKKFLGKSCSGRLIRHLTEKHLLALDRYKDIINASSEKRQSLIDEVLQEERQKKMDRKMSIFGRPERLFIPCPGCKGYYSSRSNLFTHLRIMHSNDADYESIRAKAEEIVSSLFKPKIKNEEELTVKCPLCDVARVGKSIIKHLKFAHSKDDSLTVALEQATNVFNNKMRIRETKRKMKSETEKKKLGLKYNCKICGEEFNTRATRFRHSKYKCEQNPNRAKSHWCRCGRRLASKESLEAHRKVCLNKDMSFMCDICGRVYKTRSGIYTHKRTNHNNKFDHKCKWCGKEFYQKNHYLRHLAVHTEDRKCQCEICGKQYKTPDAVHKHQMAVHHNKYPYRCDKCGHGVGKRSYLKAHKCGRVRRVQAGEEQETHDTNQGEMITDQAMFDGKGFTVHFLENQEGELDKELLVVPPGVLGGAVAVYPQDQHGALDMTTSIITELSAETTLNQTSVTDTIIAGNPLQKPSAGASFIHQMAPYSEVQAQQSISLNSDYYYTLLSMNDVNSQKQNSTATKD